LHQVEVPWSRPGSGFTLLFEAWSMLLAREMVVSEFAENLGIEDTRRWSQPRHGTAQPTSSALLNTARNSEAPILFSFLDTHVRFPR
jgi:transposase